MHRNLFIGVLVLLLSTTLLPFFDFIKVNNILFSLLGRLDVLILCLYTAFLFFKNAIKASSILLVLLFYILIMATRNINGADYIKEVYEIEVYVYLRFFCMLLLGYNFLFYQQFKSGFLILLAIGFVLNLIAIGVQDTFLRGVNNGPTLAYSIQHLLVPSIFFIFQQNNLTKREKQLVVVSFFLLLIEQILFQKRLPLARIFFIILIFSYASSFLKIYGSNFSRVLKSYFKYGLIILMTILVLSFIGLNIFQYGVATIDRFFSGGSLNETIESDTRWEIGRFIMEDLKESNQLLFGKGFGGVVYHNSFIREFEDGLRYRSSSEMGLPTIFLKGGWILIVIVVVIVFKALSTYKYAKKNNFLFACWVFVFVWVVFLYSEGFIVSIFSVNDLILGYSMGLLLRISKMKDKWPTLIANAN